ncbi:exonuclease domain-containing protein [Agreia pratensis]|uniref:DNA polymerase-3 subunit epsilon n=1 Tax=Agreia pratensis TaxID=150121 RepID=A0A1X7KLE3_9MICO|nr:exonuclease domain-containing protein [Agreia pratensis]SMG41857.1 DNA polymerase-3 subunit epsilon [Agreia pratensis]
MPLNFTAIDFETANSYRESACSVGLVKVRDGVVVDETSWFIKPQDGFDEFLPWNTKIHGIYSEDVQDARGWEEQLDELVDFVGDDHFVAHNAAFDMAVIRAASAAARVECPPNAYACSLQIARKTYSLDSYRLPVAAMAAGFEDFRHHDALADAEACAAIIIHAAERHEVNSIETLAGAAGVKISQLRPALVAPVS